MNFDKKICGNCRWGNFKMKFLSIPMQGKCEHPVFSKKYIEETDTDCIVFSKNPLTDTQKQIKHLVEKENWG